MKILGIIGDPVSHSLSPIMQNAALRKMKLPYLYLPFHVTPKNLAAFFQMVKSRRGVRWGASEIIGFNVTVPHKEKALRYLDRISPEAQAMGAVNTVVRKGNRLVGYNTDAQGFLRSLKELARFHPRGKKILILGAGGAARAVLWSVASAGAKEIILCNRTPSKVGKVVRPFRRRFRRVLIQTVPLTHRMLSAVFPKIDLLVNATSVGLKGTRFRGLPLSKLRKGTLVSDLVYRPIQTPLLKEAAQKGLLVHPGWGMLLFQGAESFRLWTGRKPEIAVIKKALLDALR